MPDPHAPTAPTFSPPTRVPAPATVRPQGHPTVLLDPLPFDPDAVEVAAAAARAVAEKRKRVRWVGRHDVDFEDRDAAPGDPVADATRSEDA